jgi:hypothetical protein
VRSDHLRSGKIKYRSCIFGCGTAAALGVSALLPVGALGSVRVHAQGAPASRATTGLKIACELDTNHCEKGIKIKNAEMRTLAITGDKFHPEWNYTVSPRPQHRAVILA